jgi:hypothetical protein
LWRVSWKTNVAVEVAPASSMMRAVAGAVKNGMAVVCVFLKWVWMLILHRAQVHKLLILHKSKKY